MAQAANFFRGKSRAVFGRNGNTFEVETESEAVNFGITALLVGAGVALVVVATTRSPRAALACAYGAARLVARR